MISQWKHHIPVITAMKGLDAIRPEYNCFISMTISVESLYGFWENWLGEKGKRETNKGVEMA